MSAFKMVDGMLGDDEAKFLYDTVRSLSDKDTVVVEIGTWVGKSAIIFSNAIRSNESAHLYCVDPFDTSSDARSEPGLKLRAARYALPLWETFNKNIKNFGVARKVTAKRGYSHEIVKDWHEPINVLFIDGNHEFEAVKRDIIDWSPLIKEGGLILFHDTYFEPPVPGSTDYHDGPGRAVECCLKNDPNWVEVCYVQSLYAVRKQTATKEITR